MFQAYGANPRPMKLSEVFTALSTGVMDGEENPLTQIYSQKFQEVQTYLSLTGHVYTPAFVVVGMRRFNSLPVEVRKILEDAARQTQAFVYAQARKEDDELRGKFAASGMKINQVDKEAFIAASKTIYEEYGQEVPGSAALIRQAIALGK